MIYASPVLVAVMLGALINYVLRARGKFVGPVKEVGQEGSESGSKAVEGREGLLIDKTKKGIRTVGTVRQF